MPKDYKKYHFLPATPGEVYLALTKELSLKLWTGAEALFTEEAGAEFSLWDGDITGKNLEFEPGIKIVQQWYFGDHPASVVTLKFHPVKQGTSLEFVQTNIPDEDFREFTSGLEQVYFRGLTDFFAE